MSGLDGKKKTALVGIGAVEVAVVVWAGLQAGPAGDDAAGTIMAAERYRADKASKDTTEGERQGGSVDDLRDDRARDLNELNGSNGDNSDRGDNFDNSDRGDNFD
ncbi:MAG: hypothetical protein ACO22W_07370, partial [Steroidobacteraceae bacterium]